MSLIAAIAVFCAIVFGPDLYQSYKNGKIFPASDAYEQFNQAVGLANSGAVATDSDLAAVDSLADILVEQHGDTHYAFLASLGAAKLSVDQGNYEVALSRLQWAEKNASNEADQQLVDFRLAQVKAELGDTDAALAYLAKPNAHFAPLYAEVRGDILSAKGQRQEAISAYEETLELIGAENSVQRNITELKLKDLQEGLGSVDDSSADASPVVETSAAE